jgi:hypothetical protein
MLQVIAAISRLLLPEPAAAKAASITIFRARGNGHGPGVPLAAADELRDRP